MMERTVLVTDERGKRIWEFLCQEFGIPRGCTHLQLSVSEGGAFYVRTDSRLTEEVPEVHPEVQEEAEDGSAAE
jgi:hypothetical protein